MRPKIRIKRILKLIEDIWSDAPDQRFYQLLINNGIIEDDYKYWVFEDDKFEKALKQRKKEWIKK